MIACGATIKLTGEEYAELRSDPRHFAMLANHVISGADDVVARRRGWVIVEQSRSAGDRRSDRSAPKRFKSTSARGGVGARGEHERAPMPSVARRVVGDGASSSRDPRVIELAATVAQH